MSGGYGGRTRRALFGSSANAVAVLGGEWQGNVRAASIEGVKGWAVNGLAVEGNTVAGLFFGASSRDIKLDAVYFEANVGEDIVHNAVGGGYGLSLDSCGFLGSGIVGERAISIVRGQSIDIAQCSFFGYDTNTPPVLINESPAGSTSGIVRNCRTGSDRVLEVASSTGFGEVVSSANNTVAVGPNGVRTEFSRFPVRVPMESANQITASITYVTSNSSGNCYVGVLVTSSAGATIQSAATAKVATANALTTVSWTIDVSAHRGESVFVTFRRIGENALDTYAGTSFTCFEGRADVRHGYR